MVWRPLAYLIIKDSFQNIIGVIDLNNNPKCHLKLKNDSLVSNLFFSFFCAEISLFGLDMLIHMAQLP